MDMRLTRNALKDHSDQVPEKRQPGSNSLFKSYPYNLPAIWSESCSVMSGSLLSHRLYSPQDSPGQNTGVGSCSLLQGIFPTQGSNPGLGRFFYQLSHQGSPRILEWVAYPFSSRSSWPRNWPRNLLHCRQILYQLSYQGSPYQLYEIGCFSLLLWNQFSLIVIGDNSNIYVIWLLW